MTFVRFLHLDEVRSLHRDSLKRYGGIDGVRDQRALESALAQPSTTFGGEYVHADLFEMAAAYTYYLCKAHAFLDGNKRVALASASAFLELNGVPLRKDTTGRADKTVISIAKGVDARRSLANVLRRLAGVPQKRRPRR